MSKKLTIYTDGGARGNPGPAAIGVLIFTEAGDIVKEHGEVIGETTNNVAEYTAVIRALEFAKELKAKSLRCFSDSQLVVNQLNGIYKIKTPHIRDLFNQVREKLLGFESVTFTHVPRENVSLQKADAQVNQALNLAGH